MPHAAILQANLERQQQGEQKLVVFIESSTRILEDFVGKIVNDALDTLASYGRVV